MKRQYKPKPAPQVRRMVFVHAKPPQETRMTQQQAARIGMEAVDAQMKVNRREANKAEGTHLQRLNAEWHEMSIALGILEAISRQGNLL